MRIPSDVICSYGIDWGRGVCHGSIVHIFDGKRRGPGDPEQEYQACSQNISNAQTTTYARRDPTTTSSNGILTPSIQRAVNQGLQDQTLTANSQSQAGQTASNLYQQLGDVLGTTQSTPYLQQSIQSFTSAWESFQTDPANSTNASVVVSSATALAQQLNTSAQQLQQIRTQTSDSVASAVSNLNANLTQLDAVNKQISADSGVQTNSPDLLDQRDALVRSISDAVGVTQVPHADGSVSLYTKNGAVLVNKSAAQFQWNNPSGSGTSWLSLTGAPGSAPGMNSSFVNGSIGAMVNFLSPDTQSSDPSVGALAKTQAQLDAFANTLAGDKPGTFGGTYAAAASSTTTDLAGAESGAARRDGFVFHHRQQRSAAEPKRLAIDPT